MSKKIVAIGGGENGRLLPDGTRVPYETGPMDQEIIKLTGKAHPNFLYNNRKFLPKSLTNNKRTTVLKCLTLIILI